MFTAKWHLTIDHPSSSYGIPVFVIDIDPDCGYGPGDRISAFRVADIVQEWGLKPERTLDEVKQAASFLRQWPDGPQIDPRIKNGGAREDAGRPPKFEKSSVVSFRLDDSMIARIPGKPGEFAKNATIKLLKEINAK